MAYKWKAYGTKSSTFNYTIWLYGKCKCKWFQNFITFLGVTHWFHVSPTQNKHYPPLSPTTFNVPKLLRRHRRSVILPYSPPSLWWVAHFFGGLYEMIWLIARSFVDTWQCNCHNHAYIFVIFRRGYVGSLVGHFWVGLEEYMVSFWGQRLYI